MTHNVSIAATDATVALLGRHRLRDRVFLIPAAAIQHFHDLNAGRHAELGEVRMHTNPRSARVTGHGDGIVPLTCGNDIRKPEPDVAEVEFFLQR
jgi:hypothetical protein